MSTDQETSLRQYLLDAKVDPVQEQLNLIHLDIIKSLDQTRITDKTRYNLQNVIRSGYYTEVNVPRIPEQGVIDEKFAPSNLPPHQMRVGQKAYQRFTFNQLYNIKTPPVGKLTFKTHKPDDLVNKGFIHKHDVSIKDQMALDQIRKRQLGEDIDKIRKLEQSRSRENEHVGVTTQLPQDQISRLANPLQVFTTPKEHDDNMEILDTFGQYLSSGLTNANIQQQTALEAIRLNRNVRTGANRLKFQTGEVERKKTIAERRGKGKGRALTVDTTRDPTRPSFDLSRFTHDPREYVAESAKDAYFFDDRNTRDMRPYIDRFDKFPPSYAAKTRLEHLKATSPLVSHGTRPGQPLFGTRKRAKSVQDPRMMPDVSDTVISVARQIKKEQRLPVQIPPAISQNKKIFEANLRDAYGLKKGEILTTALRNTMVNDFLDDYGTVISPTSKEKLLKVTQNKNTVDIFYKVIKNNRNMRATFPS